jgi:predicted  nucleic acid-binding Zn-ribbon protein
MEFSKRKRTSNLLELEQNYVIDSMNNLTISSNSQLLQKLNLKINDLEKKIDETNKLEKKIEDLNKKIDDIFRDKEYTIDKLNEEINSLKSRINEYENSPKYNNRSDYYL